MSSNPQVRMSNRIRGITLLELLVALAIAGIVLDGLPQWGRWMARDLRDRADALLHALDRARSGPSSAASGWTFVLLPVANARVAGSMGRGWTIVAAPAAGGDGGNVIAREPAARRGITIRGNRPVADYVSYTSLGHCRRIDGALQMGTFATCRTGHKLRKVILANSGRARVRQTTEDCP
jgi:type IV fimbrial biogenesis protein FimT